MRHLQATDEQSQLHELKQVQKLRHQLASLWETIPQSRVAAAYSGNEGRTHNTLMARHLAGDPALAGNRKPAERALKRLPAEIAATSGMRELLVAMLYNRAYELPHIYKLDSLPQWFVADYLRYMTNPALLFRYQGETEKYFRHMQNWIDYLHTSILQNPDSPFWMKIAELFIQIADFGPLYFTNNNLRSLYHQRGEILTQALRIKGFRIEHEFQEKENRQILRVGILSLHCTPSPETFAMLPVFEHPHKDSEYILYLLHTSDQPLEQYCKSRVNTLKQLPADLASQEKMIRQDDLDILFIATNITATCNPVCQLAAHRLARVQVVGPGSVTTTGLSTVDYYLTGTLTEAKQNIAHYTETLLWLDGPAHCFSYGPSQHNRTLPVTRQSLGIADHVTVYVSGASMFKIVPELMTLWAELLGSQHDSVLMLYPYGPNWSSAYPKELFRQRILAFLHRQGVSSNRLVLLDPEPVPDRHQIREYLGIADIYLDSYPFSGTTSFIEPLEAGLPIVSRDGMYFRSSMGAALLRSIGMHELVAESARHYLGIARRLHMDRHARDALGKRILASMKIGPPFLDSEQYSEQVNQLFHSIECRPTQNNRLNSSR